MRYVWLHGFSSSPGSGKGRFVRERLAERGARLEIPDLNQPAFRDLTVTRMLGQIDALLQGDPVVLFGSSLGGYTAALWSSLHPGRARALVLLAPAFDLAARWQLRTGSDGLRRWRDEVVTPDLAPEFIRRMRERGRDARLVLLDDGHELNADLPRLWREIEPHVPFSA